jgi:hypothetical protein
MNGTRMRMIDLVAAAGTLSLLVVLLAPGALHARAAARQQGCKDHFKILGLALHNYHDAFGVLPPGNIWEADPKRTPHNNGAAVLILPFVEQAAVYNSFNFSIGSWTFPANKTSREEKLEVYLCPDDLQMTETAGIDPSGQPTNMAFGLGSTAWCTHRELDGPKPQGVFFDNSNIGLRDIIDGTSGTVLAAEQVIDRAGRAGSAELNEGECSGELNEGQHFSDRSGTRWVAGHPSSGYFNARRTPNHRDPDCFHGAVPGGIGFLNKVPRSRHDGGVHVLMGDGAARFVLDNVDLTVWRAINTRAGQERLQM